MLIEIIRSWYKRRGRYLYIVTCIAKVIWNNSNCSWKYGNWDAGFKLVKTRLKIDSEKKKEKEGDQNGLIKAAAFMSNKSIKCHNCGENGHIKKYCKKMQIRQGYNNAHNDTSRGKGQRGLRYILGRIQLSLKSMLKTILTKSVLFNQDSLKIDRFHNSKIRRSSQRRFCSSKSYLI